MEASCEDSSEPLLLHLKRNEKWGWQGQSNPSSCVCGAAFLCTWCAPAEHLLFDRASAKTTGSILAAQEISGVFNVMTQSRHVVPMCVSCCLSP